MDSPNWSNHFGAGDLVKWSGIKRCGGAMHMGYFAANNIHQKMIEARTGKKPEFLALDEIPPMIGLAVGKSAVSYWPQAGMSHGEDVMKLFFGDDLGFTSKFPLRQLCKRGCMTKHKKKKKVCWNHLGLGTGNKGL